MNTSEANQSPQQSTRVFPPPYVSTGDSARDRLAFIHLLYKLKSQKRTGWINHQIPNPESISDHMYRMGVLAMLSDDLTLDVSKCVMMALVHDVAEAIVGDITPDEPFTKEEKHKLEADAIHSIAHDMLHDSPAAQRISALWKEYEDAESPEAKFVKDLDKFEMASQAFEYEKDHNTDPAHLQCFFDSSIPKLQHPQVKGWGQDLLTERTELQRQRSRKQ